MSAAAPAAPTDVSGAGAPAWRPFAPLVLLGKDSADPFPMFDRVWDLFVGKGIRTSFFSIGTSKSALPDLEIAESIGCPIHIVSLNAAERSQWEEVTSILKERKRDAATAIHPFSEGAETKWILPKNIRIQPALPWWGKGSLDLSGETIPTESVGTLINAACQAMKARDATGRVDIVKIDTTTAAPGLEKGVIASLLDAGCRPAVILVKWSNRPDVDLATTLAAGHLQNSGYRLVDIFDEDKFLYYFADNDMYQICSWEDKSCANPMVKELTQVIQQTIRRSAAAGAAAAAGPHHPAAAASPNNVLLL